jgi:hypothetical protein
MSDPTRIPRDETDRLLADAHRAAAPPAADEVTLDRVRTRAEALAAGRARGGARTPSHPDRSSWRRPVVWRSALAATAVIAAFGIALAISGGPGDVAFARDRLLAVLAPSGTVLHYTEQSESSWLEQMGIADGSMATEYWIDAENETMRAENRLPDGTLQSVRVESDGRTRHTVLTMQFGSDGEPLPEDEITGPEWMVMEMPSVDPFTPLGRSEFNPLWWLEQVRDAVASGLAEVTRTTTVDGEPCWEIEWDSKLDDSGPDTEVRFSATVRQSDYRPVRYETVVEQNGRTLGRHANRIVSWELLPRADVDDSMFDRKALSAGVSGVSTDNRTYTPGDLSDFDEFDAWWLGPEFEDLPLAGQPSYNEDGDARALPEVYFNWISMGSGWLPFAQSGELTMAYSASGLDDGAPGTIRVVVAAQGSESDLETLIGNLMRSSQTPKQSADTDEVSWRESAGRRYVERVETTTEGTFSRALLNLGDATILVATPDPETTARAVAALRKGN